jgi:hypothetical protein
MDWSVVQAVERRLCKREVLSSINPILTLQKKKKGTVPQTSQLNQNFLGWG